MGKSTTLNDWAVPGWDNPPIDDKDEPIELTRKSFSKPANPLRTDQIVIKKGVWSYNNFDADRLIFYAREDAFARLGLLILATSFFKTASQRVLLTHAETDIKQLGIEVHNVESFQYSQLTVEPSSFTYVPSNWPRHPWVNENLQHYEFPVFELTNEMGFSRNAEERNARDVIIGPGWINAAMRFATLLLDISRPNNPIREYDLEVYGGFQGVGPFSAQVKLWLPGSDGWEDYF